MAGTLTRWDPFAELGELRTRFDRMFDEWLTAASAHGRRRSTSCARTAIWSSALTSRDQARGGQDRGRGRHPHGLWVSTRSARRRRTSIYVRRERRYGSFSRSMALPGGRRCQEHHGIDARRRRRGDDPAPQGGDQGDGRVRASRPHPATLFGARGRPRPLRRRNRPPPGRALVQSAVG